MCLWTSAWLPRHGTATLIQYQNQLVDVPAQNPQAMSASKLEKVVANMERRMREEFRVELDVAMRSCFQRLQALEDAIEAGARADVQRNSVQVGVFLFHFNHDQTAR